MRFEHDPTARYMQAEDQFYRDWYQIGRPPTPTPEEQAATKRARRVKEALLMRAKGLAGRRRVYKMYAANTSPHLGRCVIPYADRPRRGYTLHVYKSWE